MFYNKSMLNMKVGYDLNMNAKRFKLQVMSSNHVFPALRLEMLFKKYICIIFLESPALFSIIE